MTEVNAMVADAERYLHHPASTAAQSRQGFVLQPAFNPMDHHQAAETAAGIRHIDSYEVSAVLVSLKQKAFAGFSSKRRVLKDIVIEPLRGVLNKKWGKW